MESFARRGIRTTVAVAGLAALGVGLAAPAFAVPSVPDVSGIGNTQAGADRVGTTSGLAQASDALGALPDAFTFEPPTVDRSAAAESAATETDSMQAESPESTPGVLPTIPGSPVGAQTNPRVSDIAPGSLLR